MNQPKKVSVIVPCYNESKGLKFFDKELRNHLPADYEYEIIYVNDGSEDDTIEIIKAICRKNPNTHYISFSRNFGQQNALRAGFDLSTGDCSICLDSDLQHPPSLIPKMLNKWEEGYETVGTIRIDHESISFLKRITSVLFYKFTNRISEVKLKHGVADFRLLDKKVVEQLRRFSESYIFLRAIIQWMGFKQTSITYQANERATGETKYNFKKLFAHAMNGVTAFSIKPLRFSMYLGVLFAVLAFFYAIYALIIYFFTDKALPGWTSILMSVLFIGGINLLMLGIIGEYLGKLFIENKKRPNYIISETDLKK